MQVYPPVGDYWRPDCCSVTVCLNTVSLLIICFMMVFVLVFLIPPPLPQLLLKGCNGKVESVFFTYSLSCFSL